MGTPRARGKLYVWPRAWVADTERCMRAWLTQKVAWAQVSMTEVLMFIRAQSKAKTLHSASVWRWPTGHAGHGRQRRPAISEVHKYVQNGPHPFLGSTQTICSHACPLYTAARLPTYCSAPEAPGCARVCGLYGRGRSCGGGRHRELREWAVGHRHRHAHRAATCLES